MEHQPCRTCGGKITYEEKVGLVCKACEERPATEQLVSYGIERCTNKQLWYLVNAEATGGYVRSDAKIALARRGQICPVCGVTENVTGVQYGRGFDDENPAHIDGVSEWRCTNGHRWGRFTGDVLEEDQVEPPYGDPAELERRFAYLQGLKDGMGG